MSRYSVVLVPLKTGSKKSTQITTSKILLVDSLSVYQPAEFQDVVFADKCAALLNDNVGVKK